MAASFASIVVPMLLWEFGCSNCNVIAIISSSDHPIDGDRVGRFCRILVWMMPGAGMAWVITESLLEKRLPVSKELRRLSLVLAAAGVIALVSLCARWEARPFTGAPYGSAEGWEFCLAWLLFYLGFALWPHVGNKAPGSEPRAEGRS